MSITHSKVSAVSDGGDSSLVQPSDWNAAHVISLADGDIPSSIARMTVAADDPGAVGAGYFWLSSTGNLSVRNAANDGWIAVVNTD